MLREMPSQCGLYPQRSPGEQLRVHPTRLVNEVPLGAVGLSSALTAAAGVSFGSHEEQQEEDVYTECSE